MEVGINIAEHGWRQILARMSSAQISLKLLWISSRESGIGYGNLKGYGLGSQCPYPICVALGNVPGHWRPRLYGQGDAAQGDKFTAYKRLADDPAP